MYGSYAGTKEAVAASLTQAQQGLIQALVKTKSSKPPPDPTSEQKLNEAINAFLSSAISLVPSNGVKVEVEGSIGTNSFAVQIRVHSQDLLL